VFEYWRIIRLVRLLGGSILKKKSEINVLAHELVPGMKVLSQAEAREILTRFAVNSNTIPRVPKNDAAVIALNAKPGDIIRINRVEETGKYVSYRAVSER
jgi:DNA-directed RNA polymerase subunit H